jgi:hypothetical protein
VDEKIPAAAGRIEKIQPPQPLMKRLQFDEAAGVPPGLQAGELGAHAVQKERLDHLQDVLFGRVVGSLGAALLLVHHGLARISHREGCIGPRNLR